MHPFLAFFMGAPTDPVYVQLTLPFPSLVNGLADENSASSGDGQGTNATVYPCLTTPAIP